MGYIKSLQIMYFDAVADLTGLTADKGQFAFCIDTLAFYQFNGTTWMPSSKTTVKKSSVTINAKNTGSTSIYTLENSGSLNFYVFAVIMRAVNINTVTIRPTISVGTNSSSYDNIATASLLNTLLSTLGAGGGSPQLANASIPLAGGTQIFANVSIGAVATSYSIVIEVIGFYDV